MGVGVIFLGGEVLLWAVPMASTGTYAPSLLPCSYGILPFFLPGRVGGGSFFLGGGGILLWAVPMISTGTYTPNFLPCSYGILPLF